MKTAVTLTIEISNAVRDEALPASVRESLRQVFATIAAALAHDRALSHDDAADYVASGALQAAVAMMYNHGRAAGEPHAQIALDIAEHVGDIIIDHRDNDPTTLTFKPACAT